MITVFYANVTIRTSGFIHDEFYYFCSNSGGNAIANFTLQHWKEGLKREDIKLKDIEALLMKTVFNEKGKYVRWQKLFICVDVRGFPPKSRIEMWFKFLPSVVSFPFFLCTFLPYFYPLSLYYLSQGFLRFPFLSYSFPLICFHLSWGHTFLVQLWCLGSAVSSSAGPSGARLQNGL